MPDPHVYLRVISDDFTPVRDINGALVGCIPRLPDDFADTLSDAAGGLYEVRWAMQPCVCVPLNAAVKLDGFVPVAHVTRVESAAQSVARALGVTATPDGTALSVAPSGDDPDIGRPVE